MFKIIRRYLFISTLLISLMSIAHKTDSLSDNSISAETCPSCIYSDLASSHDFELSSTETLYSVPRNSNFSNTTRTVAQAKRNTGNIGIHQGFTLAKNGKSLNKYTITLFFYSLLKFPSGLNEPSNHLISLRKLII